MVKGLVGKLHDLNIGDLIRLSMVSNNDSVNGEIVGYVFEIRSDALRLTPYNPLASWKSSPGSHYDILSQFRVNYRGKKFNLRDFDKYEVLEKATREKQD